MSERNQDAHHPATAVHLQQLQRDGHAAKSQELAAAIQLLSGVAAVYFLLHSLVVGFVDFSTTTWANVQISTSFEPDEFQDRISSGIWTIAKIVLPLLGIILFSAVLSHLVQSGAASAFRKSLFEIRNLHPANGLERLLSTSNIVRGILGIPKVAIVVLVSLTMIWYQRNEIATLQYLPVEAMVTRMIDLIFGNLAAGAGSLFAISLFDFAIEKLTYSQRHRMTDQQLRDENKMQGPDPRLADRRQQLYHDW